MPVYELNPLTDERWDELVSQHPGAGVFHSARWLSTLQKSYGYQPVAFTTSDSGKRLKNAVLFCQVRSWITGRRLVSLPFSDHCEPLADSVAEQEELLAYAAAYVARHGYGYAEIRPRTSGQRAPWIDINARPAETFYLHRLSLEAPLETLFRNLHRNCIQRKIQRAEREQLVYESGRSQSLLQKFYDLQRKTRRRHSLPPQPLTWFRNLVELMGDDLTIRLVSNQEDSVAAILTLSNKITVTFKYGCSDERFHNLGGIPFLLWKTIQEGKNQGMMELDLGRSESSHEGLVQFKDRLGAVKTTLPYWRFPGAKNAEAGRPAWQIQIAKKIFSRAPDTLVAASGRFLYRHMG